MDYHLKKNLRYCLNADAEALLHKAQIQREEDLVNSKQTEYMFSSTVSLLGNHNDDGYEENVT